MVTISKQKYDALKREATAWRHVVGAPNDGIIFDAARDNGGRGISAKEFARVLKKMVWEDTKVSQ